MPRKVTANELRWLGEEADGKRGGEHVVVWRKDEKGAERLALAEKGKLEKNEVLAQDIEVETKFEGGGLRSDYEIVLRRGDSLVPLPDADCVFITQSAFAKFVIPYYTRFRSPRQIADMKTEYFKDEYIAVAHLPPSEPLGVGGEPDGVSPEERSTLKPVKTTGY